MHSVQGFTSKDVLVTARFLELHDQLFDILNSRTHFAPGYKAALSGRTIAKAEVVFGEFINMYEVSINEHYANDFNLFNTIIFSRTLRSLMG